ncbi:MAG: hypothetical protein V8Q54_08205 [Alistipes senegalensis]
MLAQKEGKWGAVDSRGREVIPFIHDSCRYRNGREPVLAPTGTAGGPT